MLFAPLPVATVNSDNPPSNHYAFLASDDEFDAVLQRIKDEGVAFGSGPRSRTDGEINHLHEGREFCHACSCSCVLAFTIR